MGNEKALDKYYTQNLVVDMVLSALAGLGKRAGLYFPAYDFLEPSAGAGAFLRGIEKHFPYSGWFAYDIQPENNYIKQADFLEVPATFFDRRIIVGNPPYGNRSDLAVEFINRSFEWGPLVMFILPVQFRRYHTQKKIRQDARLLYSSPTLPRYAFLLDGRPYHVNTLFQLWALPEGAAMFQNLPDLRLRKPPPNKHEDFKLYIYNNTKDALKYFDKDKYQWDFAVYRQGYYNYTQKFYRTEELREGAQYLFVKYINPISRKVFEQMDFAELSQTGTTTPGFSNTDVVAEYERIKGVM